MFVNEKNIKSLCLITAFIFVTIAFISGGLWSKSVCAAGDVVKQTASKDAKDDKKVLPTLTVTLQDEDGLPIVGVNLAAMVGHMDGVKRESAETDENGQAVFKKLKGGEYYFFANIKELQSHEGYALPAAINAFKTVRSYYISESQKFALKDNEECTFVIKRGAYMWFETFLDVFRSGKIIVLNKKMGIGQIIPVAAVDFMQIYMPMRHLYQIVTIKDNDFDSWIIDFYAHEGLRIELL